MVESTFEPNITTKSVGQAIRAHLRVLKLTKKPSREEFLTIAKVAGAGILAVGAIGFIIYVLLTMLPQWVSQ
ncbi:TPA: protein translocase SEC61 complex subunit gamma [Methanosarcina acetivorans]|uniref:Protein translocase subunit SecE n=2 Tax=Methanosarcina acetivorans TaxID=2214 RepID=SECE_METAC|nr:protein translocase SEC61 complex subunit gamma [Methanosarcina acetivorans]Q8TI84.1 RecName: Full=Protein translocase subunit SecE; AltName: Full=Protein transport protein Sec61 gamma subunit homolog [Methanosarcina acetivorans C2A]AAM07616.1 protein translocase SEC61 complex gamma subunit [Methanosarcina acetivorans C2A]HIH92833.1 protein translocase SEC61 complex subunit gamma [Methanosarcina acetivorans]